MLFPGSVRAGSWDPALESHDVHVQVEAGVTPVARVSNATPCILPAQGAQTGNSKNLGREGQSATIPFSGCLVHIAD